MLGGLILKKDFLLQKVLDILYIFLSKEYPEGGEGRSRLGGSGYPKLYISSSRVEVKLHTKIQLPMFPLFSGVVNVIVVVMVGILIFFRVRSPCKISDPYDKPSWEKRLG
jgi:hypothetical protein